MGFTAPGLSINVALLSPMLVLWRAPMLKAIRKKDIPSVRCLLSSRAGSIRDVDECGANAMEMILYRQGHLLDEGNLSRLVDMLKLWTNAGYDAEEVCPTSGGSSTTIEILITVALVQRAKLGLPNDFATVEAIHSLCDACGLDAWDKWTSYTTKLHEAPLLESLLRVNKSSPSFGERVMEYSRAGTLRELCKLGLWNVSEPPFTFTTHMLLVANTWHEPLRLLFQHGIDVNGHNFTADVGYQNLHSLAGCAYLRAPPEEEITSTEEALLETDIDANEKDSQGETFLHNLILLPYTARPLAVLYHVSQKPVNWLALNGLGRTARQKYQQFWQLEIKQVNADASMQPQTTRSGSKEVPLQPQHLSDGFDIVLARTVDRCDDSMILEGVTCARHGRPHLQVVRFDGRDSDPRLIVSWQNHHEDVINFLYERELEQISKLSHPFEGCRSQDVALDETA